MQGTEKPGRALADINIVPLIDVLLVLLIIFMVITPLTPTGLNAQIPQPATDRSSEVAVVVQVAANGILKINGEESSWDGLGARMRTIFAHRADKDAFVTGEKGVAFSEVARAIDVMTSAGIQHVGLLTRSMQASEAREPEKGN
jgi:biopolymer transport protein TolR